MMLVETRGQLDGLNNEARDMLYAPFGAGSTVQSAEDS